MPTSTTILLLSQKVDLLENYLGWVITTVTGIITILIALFVTIQFFSLKSIIKKEMDLLKKRLFEDLSNKVDEKALQLKSFTEENIKELESRIKTAEQMTEMQVSRLLAISAESNNVHGPAIYYWLKHAYLAEKSQDSFKKKHIARDLRNAKRNLNLCPEQNSFISEKSSEIQAILKYLEPEYEIETKEIKKLFAAKVT